MIITVVFVRAVGFRVMIGMTLVDQPGGLKQGVRRCRQPSNRHQNNQNVS